MDDDARERGPIISEAKESVAPNAKFAVGQIVRHKLFGYRGVIVDVDPAFRGTDDWYDHMARTRPPKDQPWYHVIVHDAEHWTYVAERNLEADDSNDPVSHPDLSRHFEGPQDGKYVVRRAVN